MIKNAFLARNRWRLQFFQNYKLVDNRVCFVLMHFDLHFLRHFWHSPNKYIWWLAIWWGQSEFITSPLLPSCTVLAYSTKSRPKTLPVVVLLCCQSFSSLLPWPQRPLERCKVESFFMSERSGWSWTLLNISIFCHRSGKMRFQFLDVFFQNSIEYSFSTFF